MSIKIVTEIEMELEDALAHIRAMLEKNPKAPITINPPADPTIKVGTDRPASGTPTNGKPK